MFIQEEVLPHTAVSGFKITKIVQNYASVMKQKVTPCNFKTDKTWKNWTKIK